MVEKINRLFIILILLLRLFIQGIDLVLELALSETNLKLTHKMNLKPIIMKKMKKMKTNYQSSTLETTTGTSVKSRFHVGSAMDALLARIRVGKRQN